MESELPTTSITQPASSWLRPTHTDGAEHAFAWQPRPLTEVVEAAVVALDTNALLVPYTVSKSSVESIEAAYSALAADGRLIVPGQVAREFARSRIVKIGEIVQQVDASMSNSKIAELRAYPLLQNLDSYATARTELVTALSALKSYRSALTQLQRDIRELASSDPVGRMYGRVFRNGVVVDAAFDEKEFREELRRRYDERLPPGYKDASKADEGVGDLLIWKTLLHAMAGQGRDLVFVTAEEKADWWHRVGGSPIQPRYELVDEYRRESGGGTLHLVNLSNFLRVFTHASAAVVDEVEEAEAILGFRVDPNAVQVHDGGFLLVKGSLGYGVIRPLQQFGAAQGASVRYEAWYIPDEFDDQDVGAPLAHPSIGETGEGRGTEPIVQVGPYGIRWSACGEGSGWFYFYDPQQDASRSAPFQFAFSDVNSIEDVAFKEARYRGGQSPE